MTRQAPPSRYAGAPAAHTLPAGTVLSRVHQVEYGATEFNPVGSDVLFGGGRFDSTKEDPYPYLYGADGDDAAVAETLLRDVDANDRGARFLPKTYWRNRQLSRLRTTMPLPLITIRTGRDLGAIGQDTWLTTSNANDYPQTRAWAHWLREIDPNSCGLVWYSKREPATEALVLFGDRCPPNAIEAADGPLLGACVFGKPDGYDRLKAILANYRVSIRR